MSAPEFLLDTNILSDLIRNPGGRVAARIVQVGQNAVCTSVIVAAELRYGARKSGSERLAHRVHQLLAAIEVLPLEPPADEHYASLRHALCAAGRSIGPNDMLIAAQALALGLVLVTANTREFARVPELRIVNWLAP